MSVRQHSPQPFNAIEFVFVLIVLVIIVVMGFLATMVFRSYPDKSNTCMGFGYTFTEVIGGEQYCSRQLGDVQEAVRLRDLIDRDE
jgi:hypothetical protein